MNTEVMDGSVSSRGHTDVDQERANPEEGEEEVPYPKHVFILIFNEFCERFTYYAISSIMVTYLQEVLNFSKYHAPTAYHAWGSLTFACTLCGALISDQWLGEFNTIWSFSLVYILGMALFTMGAMPP